MQRAKRALRILAVILVALALAVGALGYATFGGTRSNVDGQHVGATLTVVADGHVAVDLLDLGDGHVALFDCGNTASGEEILAALRQALFDPEDVTAIFLTHGHRDHVAACAVFTHATIYALAADVGLAEGTQSAHSPLARFTSVRPTGVHVTHPLADGDVITVGNAEVRVYAIPGHTAGSAAYLVDGVLLVGDSASVTSDGHLRGSPWIFSDDQAQNVASMHALADRLETEHQIVNAIVTAHTGVLDEGDAIAALRAM